MKYSYLDVRLILIKYIPIGFKGNNLEPEDLEIDTTSPTVAPYTPALARLDLLADIKPQQLLVYK